jgi:hypothetical protein
MTRTNWPKVFAYAGLAVMGLALALYSTSVATAGFAAGHLGRGPGGLDLALLGSAMLLVGVATMAIFGYLALTGVWSMVRTRR